MKEMRILISAIALFLSAMLAHADSFSQDAAIKEISAAAASIKTMQCEFTQTKSLKMLGDKMVSKGSMYCEQPNKLRWEYTSPYTYSFILNDNKVLMKKGSRNDVVDVNQNKMFKEIARIMMNSVLGKSLTDTKDFKTTVALQGNTYVVTLLPQKKDMKQMFTKIVLYYEKKQAMVGKVELYEKNGDLTLIELKNVKKNTPIDASLFKIN